MSFLDAAIGFSVVMAVFAGAVTTIVEAIWRLLRARKGNLISVLKKLDEQMAAESTLWGSARDRWERLCAILNNPLRERGDRVGTHLPEAGSDALPKRFVSLLSFSGFAGASDGVDNGAGKNDGVAVGKDTVCQRSIRHLGRANALAGTFEKVSSEHVARKFAEQLASQGLPSMSGTNAVLRGELDRLIQRFEALTSSMSAEFKRRSQLTSIVLGVFVALAFNINGLRIIDEFIAKPELSKEFSAQLDATEADVLKKLEGLGSADAGSVSDAAIGIESAVERLSNRGIPIGWQYRPHCVFLERTVDGSGFDLSEPIRSILRLIDQNLPAKVGGCTGVPEQDERRPYTDLFLVVFTGVLIGLGAPFWFDVAKRLSAVRAMFGGKVSDLEAKSGKDANGSSEQRREIVDEIVNSMGEAAIMNKFKNYFNVPDGASLQCRVSDRDGNVRCRADLVNESRTVATWRSVDIMDADGISCDLKATDVFYALTLDMSFLEDDVATVEVVVSDGAGNAIGQPWVEPFPGKKGSTHTASVSVMMGRVS